jgi:C_GCAxxG_C_C family probable redox protein
MSTPRKPVPGQASFVESLFVNRDIIQLGTRGNNLLMPRVLEEMKIMKEKQHGRPDKAVKHFMKSMNCSQAVLETFAPSFGMEVEAARRIAAAFAGGMGMGAECGAVTGALMVIGMRYGKTKSKDPKADEKTFTKSAEFIKEFRTRHNQVRCSALLGANMGTTDGFGKAERMGYFVSRCPHFVSSSVEILEKLLD